MGRFNRYFCLHCKEEKFHVHCKFCGCSIYEGEECYEAGYNEYYCKDCCTLVELQASEDDSYDN